MASYDDLDAQLGYAVLFMDNYNKFSWLSYFIYKCYRVVPSVSGCKTFTLADYFDSCNMTEHNLKRMLQCFIAITILTNSESLFKMLVQSTIIAKNGLMIDVRVVNEAFDREEISQVG